MIELFAIMLTAAGATMFMLLVLATGHLDIDGLYKTKCKTNCDGCCKAKKLKKKK